MTPEKRFDYQIRNFLKSEGIYEAGTPKQEIIDPHGWFVKIWGGGYQKAGIPDLIICINGIFITCETKSVSGKASDLQKKNTSMINEGGGIGIILYPAGFEEFKKIIKGVLMCNSHTADLAHIKAANSSTKCIILTK